MKLGNPEALTEVEVLCSGVVVGVERKSLGSLFAADRSGTDGFNQTVRV